VADLATTVDNLRFPNPFLIGSGPPSTHGAVIARAFEEGWGGAVTKTACLDATRIVNVSPRYARLRDPVSGEIYGWENIELISDRPFAAWLDDFRRLKERFPDRPLIASVTEECSRDAWAEIVTRTQETGVDALELNLSCPHGLPERRMGSAVGQDPDLVARTCAWVMEFARVPVWAKLTPNITRIDEPGRAALRAGCHGLTAINTVLCVMGINLETLRPEPTVQGYSEPGGYSGRAIRPIALRMNVELARLIRDEYPGRSLSGIGGIETGQDAAQFLLVGANTVQICTGVMKHGYGMIRTLCDGLAAFMDRHGFDSVEAFRGHSLEFFTSHEELVRRYAEARRRGQAARGLPDEEWSPAELARQSETIAEDLQ